MLHLKFLLNAAVEEFWFISSHPPYSYNLNPLEFTFHGAKKQYLRNQFSFQLDNLSQTIKEVAIVR